MIIQLTQQIIDHLFEIYKEETGSKETRYPQLDRVLEVLKTEHHYELRAGSRWSGDSKFVIENSGVRFDPTYDPKGKREKTQIEKAQRLFEKKVNDYLGSIKADPSN